MLIDVISPHMDKKLEDIGHRRNASADSGLSMAVDSPTIALGMDLSAQEIGEDNQPYTSADSATSTDGKRTKYSHGNADFSDSGIAVSTDSICIEMDGRDRAERSDSNSANYSSRNSSRPGSPQENSPATFVLSEMDTEEWGGEDSTDYPECVASQAIRDFYSNLVEVIATQISLIKIVSDLYTAKLIEHTICDEASQCPALSETVKTQKVLNAVLCKIRLSQPDITPFECFVEVLSNYSSVCGDIVVGIKTKYEELKQRDEVEKNECGGCHSPNKEGRASSTPNCKARSSRQQNQMPPDMATADSERCQGENKTYNRVLSRQRSVSIGAASDVNLTQGEIKHEVERLHWSSERVSEERLRLTELEVEELQQDLDVCSRKLERRDEEKKLLQAELAFRGRRIIQLSREVLSLKCPRQQVCAVTCPHKVECERMKRQITHMEDEKLEYLATIENLTQQIEMLLNR